ncbi:nucleolar and coiled-body phosphoprotein 1 isoform X2 [Senna tora]|uniref:Nucleolar and coiled-body phosphoprotein 1 isoform X2 n=1 Tax=Senna tora TaxID=362788 RepID=A0A834W5L5_9FABA|nr:nucleolar and coiled-body phosphoprotein 1 isoform X2 [Senna tora]
MPSTPTDKKAIANTSLLAFTPRQVLLGRQTMKHKSDDNGSSNGTVSLKLEQKVLLHQSIAQYLERSGFAKTLKKFRSEAQIEVGSTSFPTLLVNLDIGMILDRIYKFWSYCDNNKKDNLDGTLVDLEEMCLKYLEICENVKTNNYNQKEQVADKHPNENREDNLIANMENASKKKKKKSEKSDSDAVRHQSGTDENLKGSSKNSVEMTDGMESKVISEEKDTDNKCKEKKKRKSKLASESLASGVEDNQLESLPTITEVKKGDDASADAITVNGETEKRSKDKRKKRSKPSSGRDAEELQIGEPNETDSKKDNVKTSNEVAIEKEKKDSKKRKRLTSDKIDTLPADGKEDDEPKRRKIESLKKSESNEQSAKMNGSLKSNSNSCKENAQESVHGSDQLQKTSEEFNGMTNGDLVNTGEKSSIQRSKKKKQMGSVEEKAVNAFQRVKADEVVFADERLQDNSYWAKDGAESGYGAKAEEILGQVRGRDFRHEKTKKKRGTYRGGHIDLQSHSIKFNYSDDE